MSRDTQSQSCVTTPPRSPFAILGFVYAASAALGTVAFFTAFILFLGNLPKASRPWLVPSADVGPSIAPALALTCNALLLVLFSLQHSLMARPFVKRFVAAVVPPALERATYVHAANLAGFIVLLFWQPVPIVLWDIDNAIIETMLWIGFASGWILLFAAALSIGMLDLLGVRQAWHWSRGRTPPALSLKTNWLYRALEHPMYVGVILGFWMTPYMTLGHAALAAQLSLYIVLAAGYERRDLRTRFGTAYDRWRLGARASGIRPAGVSAVTGMIGSELSRRFQSITAQPLSPEMRLLLARL